jgi:hypothetical protein
LRELLPFFGLAAFTLLLPMTEVILLGVALVVLSCRKVVSVYTGQAARTWPPGRPSPAHRAGDGRGARGRLRDYGRGADRRWAARRRCCSSRSPAR